MSRHGYCDGDDVDDYWSVIRWQGAVQSAIRGKRGQALLRRMAQALDAMPDQRLIAEELVREHDGACCALGSVAKLDGIDVSAVDPEDSDQVAVRFNIAPSLAREITWQNDEHVKPLKEVREGGYYLAPDGRRIEPWSRERRERNDLELVPLRYRDPTPEELERNERDRWRWVRAWVHARIIEDSDAE